jgi:hypothetical protein
MNAWLHPAPVANTFFDYAATAPPATFKSVLFIYTAGSARAIIAKEVFSRCNVDKVAVAFRKQMSADLACVLIHE